jgi:hypothetical protein
VLSHEYTNEPSGLTSRTFGVGRARPNAKTRSFAIPLRAVSPESAAIRSPTPSLQQSQRLGLGDAHVHV